MGSLILMDFVITGSGWMNIETCPTGGPSVHSTKIPNYRLHSWLLLLVIFCVCRVIVIGCVVIMDKYCNIDRFCFLKKVCRFLKASWIALKTPFNFVSFLGQWRAFQHRSTSWKISVLGCSCSYRIGLCISTTHSDPFKQQDRSNSRTSGGRAGRSRRRGKRNALEK